jgi:hypothetical protein
MYSSRTVFYKVGLLFHVKFRVFLDVSPCSHTEIGRRFRGAYCLHHLPDYVVRNSETSVNFNVTTQRYIPEDSKLHTRRRENLKSYCFMCLWILETLLNGIQKCRGEYLNPN